MCDSSPPHGLQLTRLLCPWDFPGKMYWSGVPLPSPGIDGGPTLNYAGISDSANGWHPTPMLSKGQPNLLQKSLETSEKTPKMISFRFVCVCAEVLPSCPTLCDPMDCSMPTYLSMEFSRQENWGGLPCPPPGNLSNPGFEPVSPVAPELQDSLLLSHREGPIFCSNIMLLIWNKLHWMKIRH